MVVAEANSTVAILRPHPGRTERIKVPSVFYAKRITWSNASSSIHCTDAKLTQSLSVLTRANVAIQGGVVRQADLVENPIKAALVLTVEGQDVFMERNDAVLNEHIPARFPRHFKRKNTTRIQRAISGWRHFDYHLKRGPDLLDVFPRIRLEMHWLEPINGDWDDVGAEYRPVGANLLPDGVLVHQLVVSQEQENRPLGFTLHNDGDTDVYPNLFYFDPVELTISESPAQLLGCC